MININRLGGAVSAAVLSSLLFAIPAKAEDTLEKLKEQGFARIAIANEPPFTAVNPDGTVSGAGPDVARAVFKKLGVNDVVASISEYGAMIPGLQAGRHDAVTAGLFMKPERCNAVAYSEPILCDAEAFLVKKGNPQGFKSYADIAKDSSATIGAPGGGTEERLSLEAGVPRDRVIVVPDGQSGLKMLQDGRIDVYSLPVLSINDLVKKANDPNIEVVAPVVGAPVYCDGAAFRKNDTALRDAFDKELAAMKQSGEFAKIIEPYGFSAEAAMSTTREKLCSASN
ncbi:ectoine/hydroxyectoine ABC transporter substrate-binding protein EhuB [Paramesorhizobium deserti]|uniref:Ectoine/hydroxyectoine ABC transporter substrate-binding protein EhuB n=1 Tax=Paramesorhizobium deserti TaxID=1494590 RepID=A0A135HQ34_9HYPH|nr:ectoine/hydroxyectoine ABC transporter substrate-binding protein EhuB [Paramesorhizobium deserti]KXF75223.1 ectoine/hydroxyectoine ABC transporter substrate-binding protein EhuB [Paramesorhizobium deserti]